jgi:hypothetical protein
MRRKWGENNKFRPNRLGKISADMAWTTESAGERLVGMWIGGIKEWISRIGRDVLHRMDEVRGFAQGGKAKKK